MSEINTEQPRRFATRILPWLITAIFFAIYLATLNRWVSANSLGLVAQISGWDGQIPFQSPLMWLITRPLKLLGEQNLPLAANILTAALAAVNVGLLARCVAIFPADRTHSQRIRGQIDGLPMDAPLNWAPPILAAGLLGFQLTFWENATVVTGEMLNLCLFALAVRCLAQYRLDERDLRLQQFAFVVGLGCANDWSMVAYLPFFFVALAWVVGWELLNARRLITLMVALGFGLLLYLLMPIVGAGAPGMPDSFGVRFIELIKLQKVVIQNAPRSGPLLLALILLVPAVFVSIRWRSGGSSGTDQILKNFFLVLLRVAWFVGGIYVAYDLAISPRALVTTHPQGDRLALLTFSWIGALSVGVSAGWFLLIGTASPEKKWERQAGALSILAKLAAGLCLLTVIAVPASLAWRNWPKLAAQNGPILAQLAEDLLRSLPGKPVIVVTEDPALSVILQAALRRNPSSPRHLLIQTRSAILPEYRQQLNARFGAEFPALAGFARAETNVAGVFLDLLSSTAREGRAFYLNPPVFDPRTTFLLESLRTRPQGLIYVIEPYDKGQISPPPLTAAQADGVVSEWKGRMDLVRLITNAASVKALTVEIAANIYSRAANANGVELQRAGRLTDASHLFQVSRELVPENAAAEVNAAVNAALQAHKPIGVDVQKPLAGKPPLALIEHFGPVDEPVFLSSLALALAQATTPLARASAVASSRALELAPDNATAAEAYARALLAAGEPQLATNAIAQARRLADQTGADKRVQAGIELLQARLALGTGDIPGAENTLINALKRFPDEGVLIDGICDFYASVGMATNALPYADQYLKRHLDDDVILARRGSLLVEAGRLAEAVEVLDSVLGRKPDLVEAHLSRGAALLLLNKPAVARVDFGFALKENPNFARALLGMGRAYRAENNDLDAQHHFEKVMELTPTNSIFHKAAKNQLETMQRK